MKFDKINFKKSIVEITPEIARIHSHICGDGCVYRTREKRSPGALLQHKRKNIYKNEHVIEYDNNCKELLEEFKRDVNIAFNRNPSIRKNRIEMKGAKWIVNKLNLIGKNSYTWYIPKFITNSSKKVTCSWLRAFFDDEAHVSKSQKRIVLNIVNKNGLKQIQDLLKKLGILSKLHGPYKYKKFQSYHLNIYRDSLKKYANLIGFTHPKKRQNLLELVSYIKN